MLRSNRANRWRTFLRGFVCVLWTAALAGCLAFAVPTREHTPKGFPTRGMIKDDSFAFVEPGSTNRQEILLRLGEPDAASADETIFVYRWRTVHGLWGIAGIARGSDAIAEAGYINEDRHDVALEFDDRGAVVRHGALDDWGWPATSGTADRDSVPLELSVVHQRASGHHRASTLRLGGGVFELEPVHQFTSEEEEAGRGVSLPLDGVASLTRSKESETQWAKGHLSYTVGFSEETPVGRRVRFLVELLDAPRLIAFLRHHCPNLET